MLAPYDFPPCIVAPTPTVVSFLPNHPGGVVAVIVRVDVFIGKFSLSRVLTGLISGVPGIPSVTSLEVSAVRGRGDEQMRRYLKTRPSCFFLMNRPPTFTVKKLKISTPPSPPPARLLPPTGTPICFFSLYLLLGHFYY